MKKFITLFSFVYFIGTFLTVSAQQNTDVLNDIPSDYLKRSPIYDYTERQLNNVDSIPDFQLKETKVKISGTIYKSDGITPAKDVILYIYQQDESGDYEVKKANNKRYVHHSGWIKTNADGHYTFYTFVPNTDVRNREMQQIHAVIKEVNTTEYEIIDFLFDNDPFLTKRCRKKMDKAGSNNILKLQKKEDLHVATRDIVLNESISLSK